GAPLPTTGSGTAGVSGRTCTYFTVVSSSRRTRRGFRMNSKRLYAQVITRFDRFAPEREGRRTEFQQVLEAFLTKQEQLSESRSRTDRRCLAGQVSPPVFGELRN